jgi:hypothetical protein
MSIRQTDGFSEGFSRFVFDENAKSFRDQVLSIAKSGDVRIDVLVAAVADLLGITAAQADRQSGQSTLPDKMNAFCQRVEETYERMRGQKWTGTKVS